jgi:hypothetical protein
VIRIRPDPSRGCRRDRRRGRTGRGGDSGTPRTARRRRPPRRPRAVPARQGLRDSSAPSRSASSHRWQWADSTFRHPISSAARVFTSTAVADRASLSGGRRLHAVRACPTALDLDAWIFTVAERDRSEDRSGLPRIRPRVHERRRVGVKCDARKPHACARGRRRGRTGATRQSPACSARFTCSRRTASSPSARTTGVTALPTGGSLLLQRELPGYYWLFRDHADTANVGVGMLLDTVPPTRDHLRDLLNRPDRQRRRSSGTPRRRHAEREGGRLCR